MNDKWLSGAGTAVGAVGALLCAVGVVARVAGEFWLMGFESMTLFETGVGVMVGACLLKLMSIERTGRDRI